MDTTKVMGLKIQRSSWITQAGPVCTHEPLGAEGLSASAGGVGG